MEADAALRKCIAITNQTNASEIICPIIVLLGDALANYYIYPNTDCYQAEAEPMKLALIFGKKVFLVIG